MSLKSHQVVRLLEKSGSHQRGGQLILLMDGFRLLPLPPVQSSFCLISGDLIYFFHSVMSGIALLSIPHNGHSSRFILAHVDGGSPAVYHVFSRLRDQGHTHQRIKYKSKRFPFIYKGIRFSVMQGFQKELSLAFSMVFLLYGFFIFQNIRRRFSPSQSIRCRRSPYSRIPDRNNWQRFRRPEER